MARLWKANAHWNRLHGPANLVMASRWPLTVPPVDATNALQLKIQEEFFDMSTNMEACFAGLHEPRTQLEAAGVTL